VVLVRGTGLSLALSVLEGHGIWSEIGSRTWGREVATASIV